MSMGLLLDIGIRLAALTVAAWIAARWLCLPMRQLADAARELGNHVGTDRGPDRRQPVPERGPQECRDAARVFNRMQTQIQQQLQERDSFVAAVSHDLRTPLTRLSLRTESLKSAAQRAQFRQDIREMDEMIRVTLDALLGFAKAEPFVLLDVQALAHDVVADQQARGQAAQVVGQAQPLRARPLALKRCLCNLVENAARYAGGFSIHLLDSDTALRIQVRDSGPGIPQAELLNVLAPFHRLEVSRNRRHGGVGLGLSIAQDIAKQHRGSLTLRNAPEGGLIAELALPRSVT